MILIRNTDLTRRKLGSKYNMAAIEGIKQIDLTKVDISAFKEQNTGCIVLTHVNRILLQYRPDNWRTFPGMVATFDWMMSNGRLLNAKIEGYWGEI